MNFKKKYIASINYLIKSGINVSWMRWIQGGDAIEFISHKKEILNNSTDQQEKFRETKIPILFFWKCNMDKKKSGKCNHDYQTYK